MTQHTVTRRCRNCRVILDGERSITFCSPLCQHEYEQRTGWTNTPLVPQPVYLSKVRVVNRKHGRDRII